MAFLVAALLAACDCEPTTPAELIEQADVIFTGELSNLSEDADGCSGNGSWNFAMLVLEVYKGEVAERVNVRSEAARAESCGMPVTREGRFLVYARKLENFREYASDLCMGTKKIEEASVDLTLLGDSTAPGDVGCMAMPFNRDTWMFVTLVWLVRSRRLRARSSTPEPPAPRPPTAAAR